MLIFDRKAFKSGKQLVKEVISTGKKDADGKEILEIKVYTFTVSDKGKSFSFADENKVLAEYPHLFKKA